MGSSGSELAPWAAVPAPPAGSAIAIPATTSASPAPRPPTERLCSRELLGPAGRRGAQGGSAADLRRLFGRGTAVVPTVSRDVLAAGPDPAALRAAAARWAEELA